MKYSKALDTVDIEAITHHCYESNYHHQIASIERDTFDVPYSHYDLSEYLMNTNSFCRAAFWDGELVGYILFTTSPKLWYLDRIAVRNENRRHGIGRQLMKSFLTTKRRPPHSVAIVDERLVDGCLFLRECGWFCNVQLSAIHHGHMPDLLYFSHRKTRIA